MYIARIKNNEISVIQEYGAAKKLNYSGPDSQFLRLGRISGKFYAIIHIYRQ